MYFKIWQKFAVLKATYEFGQHNPSSDLAMCWTDIELWCDFWHAQENSVLSEVSKQVLYSTQSPILCVLRAGKVVGASSRAPTPILY